jgi:hypothetical protein
MPLTRNASLLISRVFELISQTSYTHDRSIEQWKLLFESPDMDIYGTSRPIVVIPPHNVQQNVS